MDALKYQFLANVSVAQNVMTGIGQRTIIYANQNGEFPTLDQLGYQSDVGSGGLVATSSDIVPYADIITLQNIPCGRGTQIVVHMNAYELGDPLIYDGSGMGYLYLFIYHTANGVINTFPSYSFYSISANNINLNLLSGGWINVDDPAYSAAFNNAVNESTCM